jgi:hypothetical protein
MLPFENKSCASLYRPAQNKQPFLHWKPERSEQQKWAFPMPSIPQVTGSPFSRYKIKSIISDECEMTIFSQGYQIWTKFYWRKSHAAWVSQR